MKKITCIAVTTALLTLLPGCVSMSKLAKQLKDDPAIVTVRMGTPWGNQQLNRIGGTTNTVLVAPDGAVTINPR